jgi:cytidine deaminase
MRPAVEQAFEKALAAFPSKVRPLLRQMPLQTGRLGARDVDALCKTMHLTPRGLALALLPLAQVFSRPEISGFQVGAVAVATEAGAPICGHPERPDLALFLGVNLEFDSLPLYHTIHAEQTAALNAWHSDARQLHALAVSALPCGGCRQFLMEATAGRDLAIIMPSADGLPQNAHLSDLLPAPFVPADLKKRDSLFSRRPKGSRPDGESARSNWPADSMLKVAMEAAVDSYAPYTHNLAGCALSLPGGNVISGRSLESAAYNPGLTALQSALALAALTGADLKTDIQQVALVERPTKASQNAAAERFLSTWVPRVKLNFHCF